MTMTPHKIHHSPVAPSSSNTPVTKMLVSSSSSRSRKKIKHSRSSLEFLDVVAAPAPTPTLLPPLRSSKSPNTKKNQTKSVFLSLPSSEEATVIAQVATAAAVSSNTRRFRGLLHQRIMSPESQSKLDRLRANSSDCYTPAQENNSREGRGTEKSEVAITEQSIVSKKQDITDTTTTPEPIIQDDSEENSGGEALTPIDIRKSNKKRSSTRSLLEMLDVEDNIVTVDDEQQQPQKYPQNPRRNASSTSNGPLPSSFNSVSTKNIPNEQNIKQTEESYSPLDYRLETLTQRTKKDRSSTSDSNTDNYSNNSDNNNIIHGNDSTTLKSYYDQWITSGVDGATSESRVKDRLHKSRPTNKSHNRGKEIKNKSKHISDEEIVDDPSSSVVSSSSGSVRDDDDHRYDHFEREPSPIDHIATNTNDLKSLDRKANREGTLHREMRENNESPLRQLDTTKQFEDTKRQLEVEYNKLAILMQQLERKSQAQQYMEGSKGSSTTPHDDNTQAIHKELLVEYGRLALLNKELERKINLPNVDNGVTRQPTTSVVYQQEKQDSALENSPSSFLKQDSKRKTILNHDMIFSAGQYGDTTFEDDSSCRISSDDVAFGNMIYQQRMAQKQKHSFESSPHDYADNIDDLQRRVCRGRERKPSYHRRGYTSYNDVHHGRDFSHRSELGSEVRLSSSASKRKKKRHRRVVETLTRVIHEESEEEGSSSTGGRNRPKIRHIVHPPRKYLNDEKEYHYDEEESVHDSNIKKSRARASSGYRKRYPNASFLSKNSILSPRNHGDSSSDDADDVRGGRNRTTRPRKHTGYSLNSLKMQRKYG